MNKKAYFQPAVKVVKIQLSTIIAGSITATNGDGPGIGENWSKGNSNSRKGSFFDGED